MKKKKKKKNKDYGILKAMIPYYIVSCGGFVSFIKYIEKKNWVEMKKLLCGSVEEFYNLIEGEVE